MKKLLYATLLLSLAAVSCDIVEFKNPAVKVKDSSGKYYKTVIVEKDDNDIKFKVPKLQSGKNYIYKISGIRKKGSGNFTCMMS